MCEGGELRKVHSLIYGSTVKATQLLTATKKSAMNTFVCCV